MQTVQTPMRPNRPHISSSIQISKSKDTKQTEHPTFGRICLNASRFSCRPHNPPPSTATASLQPLAFGDAVSRQTSKYPQDTKRQIGELFTKIPIYPQFPMLGEISDQMINGFPQLCCATFSTHAGRKTGFRDFSQRIASNPTTAAT